MFESSASAFPIGCVYFNQNSTQQITNRSEWLTKNSSLYLWLIRRQSSFV